MSLKEIKERRWNGYQNHGCQKNIGIEIHAPPKTVTKTLKQSLALPFKRRIRLVSLNKSYTKNSAQDGKK